MAAENWKRGGMNGLLAVLALMAPSGVLVHADEAPGPNTNTLEQAQAREFGIFFGGTATQYDLCVKKGFLPKGDQSAEEAAKLFMEKARATTQGADQSAYVQDGWNMMKREIAENESFYTQEKCASVGKQWMKMLVEIRKK
jgi:hypothetical protein